ncbi:MAG: hypothetical protein JKY41_10305 [Rhodobacteraceae bacterium]|nr:hypothetical protein [Paracoccaceae bacterium]
MLKLNTILNAGILAASTTFFITASPVSAQTMTDLGLLQSGTFAYAYELNADGSVVVGSGNTTNGQQAFRWNSTGGTMQNISAAGWTFSNAVALNSDGNVIVGYGDYQGTGLNNYRAYRWTQAGGMQSLGTFGNFSVGISTNDNGSVVVGYNGTASGNRAFRWDETGGSLVVGHADLTVGGNLAFLWDVVMVAASIRTLLCKLC